MTYDEIQEVLRKSLADLFTIDQFLLENDASERAITHKLAEHMQRHIPILNVDCEYNRNAEQGRYEPKSIEVLKSEARKTINEQSGNLDESFLLSISTFPDIIVHRRRTNAENLLIIEVKKDNSSRHVDRHHDYLKLKAFTENSEKNSYRFRYGVFILLYTGPKHPESAELTWFVEGNELIT